MSQGEVQILSKQLHDLTVLVKKHTETVQIHMDKSDKHIEEDTKWKSEMTPILDGMTELKTVIEAVKASNSNFKFVKWVASFWKELGIIVLGLWGIIKLIITLK